MKPSTPSADGSADAAFRAQRVEALRTRRGQLRPSTWAAIAGIVLVAAVITASRSEPDDHVAKEGRSQKVIASSAKRAGGTICVGWPIGLLPSQKPSDRSRKIIVWGTRDDLHLRNAGASPVVVDVVAQAGQLASVERDVEKLGDDHLRFEIGPKAEVAFNATCSITSLRLSGTSDGGAALATGAFQLGDGPADAPLVLTKTTRR